MQILFDVILWALACIGLWSCLNWVWEFVESPSPKAGTIEIVVTNCDQYVEGILRLLERQVKDLRFVHVKVYCVDCSDLTIEIVKRMHKRKPWFSFYVVEGSQPSIPIVSENEPDERVCRIELSSYTDPKRAWQIVQAWLSN